jgi:hypothetical protein
MCRHVHGRKERIQHGTLAPDRRRSPDGLCSTLPVKNVPDLTNRWLQLGNEGQQLAVTGGILQGSVLGPTLWNLFYDGLLRMQVPKGVKIIAFADDVAVVAVAQNGALAEEMVNPVLADISHWMTTNELTLAPAKSESIVLTTKHSYRDPVLWIDGHRILVVKEKRYLESSWTLDSHL